MKQQTCRLFRAVATAAVVLTLFNGLAQAATTSSPAVVKGLTWLQSQVQTSGALANETTSIATPLQNRAESLQTFKLLATVPTTLADLLATDTESNTEYLARRAVELKLAGRDASTIIALLLSRQNIDGGFGGGTGYSSAALDTAWVMLAMAQNGVSIGTAAQNARGYLLSTIQADGGVGTGSDNIRIATSSLALLALQAFPQNLTSATAIKQINSWLLLKQGADGSWLKDSYQTALALAAVLPLTTDPTISTTASSYLTALQGADGSWGGDPFLTSVVLRALSTTPPAPATTGTSAISGLVVDQATTAPLAGATVTLSGASSATLTTGANGTFNFTSLPAGSYTLQVTSTGYNNYTNTYQLNTSQTLNAGTIALTQITTSGIVSGKVTDGTTGLALAGAMVQVNAASAVTDTSGLYKITGVAPGAITLSASASGYAATSATANILGGKTLDYSPALYAPGTVAPTTGIFTGKVVAAGTNSPLAGVSIQLNGTTAGTTAADGSFNLTLAPASYTVTYVLTGYNSATATFLLTAGTTVNQGTVTLTPQQSTSNISGTVRDATTGKPINGAQIQVLGGSVVTTGTNGAYTLSSLVGTTFDLRVSATGYVSQALRLTVKQPMNFTQDFPLQMQTGLGLSLGALMVSPGSAGSRADVTVGTTLANSATGSQTAIVLTMQVLNAAGKVVSSATAYDKTGVNMLGQIPIDPGQQLPVLFKWNTAQFPPGTYSLVARVVAAGSITQATPLGQVLASGQGTLVITPDQHFNGSVTANPPVLQLGAATPVQLSAVLSNDGNTDLPAQAYKLTLTNKATGAVVATQQVNGVAFSPNVLQNLTFANWTPAAGGGNFQIDVQAVTSPSLGDVVGKVYVGDAATGSFTVNKLAVPAGTQSIKGNIHVTGQDATQGTVSDPLAPLIKAAIQKAVTYNDSVASNWILIHGCSGCHVGAQALAAGEMNLKVAPNYNTAQRNIIFNKLVNDQSLDGSITSFASSPQVQTYLSLWALDSWHAKQDIAGTLLKGAMWVIRQQLANGSWYNDAPTGWWDSYAANTGLNIKSLVDLTTLMKQTPASAIPQIYALNPLVTGAQVPGIYKGAAADAAGNLYVTSSTAGTLTLVRPDGTTQILLTGMAGPRPPTFGSDGALYIPTDGGVIRYTLAGQQTVLTSTGATSVALGPDGNIYAAAYRNQEILQITPAGVVSVWLHGGPLYYPYFITFDSTGAMIVTDLGYIRIVKINPDKSYSVMPTPPGNYYSVLPDGPNMLVATPTGLVRFNSSWQATPLIDGQVWSLARSADGKVLVGSAGNSLDYLYFGSLPFASFDGAITNAVNWLLVDGNTDSTDNIQLAFRLIGLGAANKYFAGTSLAATIQAKMASVGALLKSHQMADGGWARNPYLASYYYGSDSMVTAQVGMALDYLNPSPQDPVVQKAVKLLLSRQQVDGSWRSENRILYTNLAATTWVAIWLPIALDRIGGIDTDLSVSMPANVTLTNPSLAPTSSATNAVGGMDYFWHLPSVKSAGVDVNFDLTLNNMVLGEARPVASNAYLTFNNTFTGQPTNAPITIPRVTASAFLGLGVTTDQTSYGANSPVNIAAAVNNTSATGVLDGSVKLEIYSADNILAGVAGLPINFTALAAGAQTTLTGTWSTGTIAAGSYYVLATLYDAQNNKVGTAQSAFTIKASGSGGNLPGSTGVGATISSDKQSYQPYNKVNISGRISNLTQNMAFNGLQPVITVYRPDGTVLFTEQRTLGQLLAGAFIDEAYASQLSSAAAGQYNVVLSIQDANAVEVARATTTFTVLSTANTGNGLKGTVGALPKIVPQTDPVTLSWTASNLGNADFAALPVKLTIVDPSTLTVMSQQTYSIALAQTKTYQTAFTWDTTPAAVGSTYVAILAVTVGGKDIVLAQDNFLVTYPPVKLGVTQNTVRQSRVLVWLACDNLTESADGQGGNGTGDGKKTQGDNGGSGDKAHDGHDQPEVPACLQARTTYLQGLLNGLKVPYLITSKRDDFRNAFREGRYNVYWLSGDIALDDAAVGDKGHNDHAQSDQGQAGNGDHGKDQGHAEETKLLEEIREAVYRGDSLIEDGIKHGQTLADAAGLTDTSGQLPGKNLVLNTAGQLFSAQNLPTDGHALKLRTASGVAEATFVLPAHGDDGNNGQQGTRQQTAQSSDGQGPDDGHKPATPWPAIVSNLYGNGHALTFGFDLVDTLQNSAASATWNTLFQTGFTWLMPLLPTPYSAGAYVELDTDIQNQARGVDLGVASYLPQGATLLQTMPSATLDAKGQPSWLFTLPAAATQTLLMDLRLPQITGNHKLLTTIDSIRNGKRRRYGEYSYYWQVAASDTLGDKLTGDLNALALVNEDELEARAAALAKLQRALTLIAQPKYGEAIEALLQAVDQVRHIKSVDVSTIRLNIDRLLQETEWNWLRTGGAAGTAGEASHKAQKPAARSAPRARRKTKRH